jgi:heterodisulfide reductase subunit B
MLLPVLLRRKHRVQEHCAVCDGDGVLSGSYIFARSTVCTCGAGPVNELTLHAADCDTVPCPFCHLSLKEAA